MKSEEKDHFMLNRILPASFAGVLFVSQSFGQIAAPSEPVQSSILPRSASDSAPPAESKRLFGIIPNYRTSPSLTSYEPIKTSEKFKVASEDAFDRGTIGLSALFGAESQLTDANRSFGQGGPGFGRYFGAAYGDLVIGDFMTEGVFPTILHQDPRYFRRGAGTRPSRLAYAAGQVFWTRSDSGRTQFNYSEVLGNATAVAISNAYYENNRTAADNVSKLGMQLAVDMMANVLKEFWPDLEGKFKRKH